jgi:hypothetical protein
MARANAVSRDLAAAGHRRTSVSRKVVHGWTVHYAGFRCSNMSHGAVRVEYETGTEAHSMGKDRQEKIRKRFIARYRAALEPKYAVSGMENSFGRAVLVIRDKPVNED